MPFPAPGHAPASFGGVDVQGWVVVGLALVLFAYLVPHLVATRQQFADSRVEDRFSTGLRVVRADRKSVV